MDTTDARALEDHLRAQNQPGILSAEEFQRKGLKAHRDMLVPIRAIEHPSFKTYLAVQDKVNGNVLLTTFGGIGDQICIEPTLRWATSGGFLDPDRPKWRPMITLASEHPELYGHLEFDDVYNLREEQPIVEDYLEFRPSVDQSSISDMFINHMTTVCTDYPSLIAFRRQLKVCDRNVILKPEEPESSALTDVALAALKGEKLVGFHCGKHWESKTFPVDYWNSELNDLKKRGFTPVLFGAANTRHGGGYVDVDRSGCVDLLDKTSIMESVWLLQRLPLLVCSDSSPLHMAVTGNAFIAFIATAKEADYVTHWRRNLAGVNEWGWRMRNFSKGGKWEEFCNLPVSNDPISVEKCDPKQMRKWLPKVGEIGDWCEEKFDEHRRSV